MKIHLETNIPELSEFYLQTLVLLYCPCEVFGKNDTSVSQLYVKAQSDENGISVSITLSDMGKEYTASEVEKDKECYPDGINIAKTVVGRAFCTCAAKIYGYTSPFGIITGIRPAKLALSYLERGFDENIIREIFTSIYLIEPEKADILIDIARRERMVLHSLENKSFSLYVSVPFCPTRCSYCSFVSYSTPRLLSMIPDYLERLQRDIKNIGAITKELGLSLYSVYVGGGTPSILSDEQIKRLLSCVQDNFDFDVLREFTFEAGRPDTVTEQKLQTLKDFGVGRISINTQSANNTVLENIGRQHTFEDYIEKMNIAQKIGFDCINTDIIAGLPGESVDSFCDSLDKVIAQNVENVTVHSLTLKKSSFLRVDKEYDLLNDSIRVRRMLDYSQSKLKNEGYLPYYIYRQKNTVGNLENTGYSKPGSEGLYNIIMMEELHSVFSAGASAVTKLVSKDRHKIDRLFEQKYPYEYLSQDNSSLDIKLVEKFYNEHF